MLSLVLTLLALTVVILTTAARLNDIPKTDRSKLAIVRRLGLFLCGASSAAIGVYRLFDACIPDALLATFSGGLALMLITTPNGLPWWKFITGEWLHPHADGSFGWPARIAFVIRPSLRRGVQS